MQEGRAASLGVGGVLLTVTFGLVGACSSDGTPTARETRERAVCVDNGAGLGVGSGVDGAYAPGASQTFPETATSASGAAGTTTLTVGSAAGFAAGDLVLVHQTQGANAGVWEIENVAVAAAGTLTLALPLQNAYASDATDAAQAVRVAQFTTVTIGAGVTVRAPVWNGTTGGLLPFLATSTVTINGTLEANAAGYRGGAGDGGNNTCPGTPKAGFQGESGVGVGARATTANGEGGGGGGTEAAFCCSMCPPTPGTTGDSGGGGGGYGVAGAAGLGSAVVGVGGGTTGPADLTSIFFGGGGGAGGGNCMKSSPPGGAGGGAIVISADALTVGAAGSITANGTTPTINGLMNWEGAGGGGAGGAISIATNTLTLPATNLSATGAAGAEQCAGSGGAGGAGRVLVTCGTVNGAACTGSTGAFSNPTAVVGAFCSFATCTTNAECPTATPVCNPTTHACVECDADSDCTGNANGPVCDTTKNTCGSCSPTNTAVCTGNTPVCDVAAPSDQCAACTGDFGTSTAEACPTAALPACRTTGSNAGSCVECAANGDCVGNPAGSLCDLTSNTCGTCTATDTTPCTGTTPVCNVGAPSDTCVACTGDFGTTTADACPTAALPTCVLTGSNAGACVECLADSDCAGSANGPLCDGTTDTCGTCTSTNTAACTGDTPICNVSGAHDECTACTGNFGTTTADACPTAALPVCLTTGAAAGTCVECATSADCVAKSTPVCDGATHDCVACNGDDGTSATRACPTATNPYCEASGACGQCATNTDCTTGTHAGPFCDTTTGACGTACTTDAECGAGNWCDETAGMCTPQLANGTTMPTDAAHTNPTLNGTCTAAAAVVVCKSGVCDAKDSECGYANGDGPCTLTNGAIVCQSGTCSTNGTCMATGGCNVDADCSSSDWCDETVHQCTAKLANGAGMPTDTAHTNPTLNGTCTVAAGALVCISAVCDAKDNECGYADGDGPCTASNGAMVCQSGLCGPTGVCIAMGGCTADVDCPKGDWCDETAHECKAKLANGTGIPSDPAHTNPTLNGTCTAAAGALVCTSGVCDMKNNECGYGNGEGPCTSSTAPTVCQSKICGTGGANSGLCVACVSSSDCPSGSMCSPTTNACVPCASPSCASTTSDAGAVCHADDDCPQNFYCAATGACAPTLPEGASCTRAAECQSDQCTAGICSIVVTSGSGIFCAVRAPGGSDRPGDAGLCVCAAALAGARLRRRRRGSSAAPPLALRP